MMANDDRADAVHDSYDSASVDMSSQSPIDPYGNKSGGSGYGSGQSDSGKSPLSMSLGFLKTLTEKKSTRGSCGTVPWLYMN